jgi:hypothetical protein
MNLLFIEMIYSFTLSFICVGLADRLAVHISSGTTMKIFIGRVLLYCEVNSTHAIIMQIILSWQVNADIDLWVLHHKHEHILRNSWGSKQRSHELQLQSHTSRLLILLSAWTYYLLIEIT